MALNLDRFIDRSEALSILGQHRLTPYYLDRYQYWLRPDRYLSPMAIQYSLGNQPFYRYIDVVNFVAMVLEERNHRIPARQEVNQQIGETFRETHRVGFLIWSAEWYDTVHNPVTKQSITREPDIGWHSSSFWDGSGRLIDAVNEALDVMTKVEGDIYYQYGKWR